jgi:hypothetical protein
MRKSLAIAANGAADVSKTGQTHISARGKIDALREEKCSKKLNRETWFN